MAPVGPTALGACRMAIPYVAVFAVYMVARLLALKGFQNTKEDHTYLAMFLTWPSVLWFYIQHLVWPTHLNPFYFRDFYTHVTCAMLCFPRSSWERWG